MTVKRVVVIGGGVIGLSTALRILESRPGVSVTVVAEKYTPHTTGDGAAGFWQPYELGNTPQHKIRQWGSETLDQLLKLAYAEDASRIGTFLVSGYDIFRNRNEVLQEPFWKDMVLGYRLMTQDELDLFPNYRWGHAYTTVVAECRHYLPWLMECIARQGGSFEERLIKSFDELSEYDVVVNCSGLGARDLADDKQLTPLKGQVMRVEAPWIKNFVNADDEDLYILPGGSSIVLGGTHDSNDETPEPDPIQSRRILEGCSRLLPSLKAAKFIQEWVGFRPGRESIRLEKETITTSDNKTMKVVHNYGHGGGGITLHWGCAKEACQLVLEELNDGVTKTSKL